MKLVIQRVTEAKVEVDSRVVGSIKKGLLVLVGVSKDDDEEVCRKYADKLINLRIFEDEDGKTNLNLNQVEGELLMVSQFTLLAACKKGNRPSFVEAGDPKRAEELYEYMIEILRDRCNKVEKGVFGEDMKVTLVNDGPFTIVLEL